MSKLHNIDDITLGAMAVIISSVSPRDEEGLTVKETAEVLNISVSRLEQMRYNNEDPRFYREDGKILYLPSSIKEYIQLCTNKKGLK